MAHGIKVPTDFEDQSVIDVIVSTSSGSPRQELIVWRWQERAVVNEWFAGSFPFFHPSIVDSSFLTVLFQGVSIIVSLTCGRHLPGISR